MRKVNEHTPAMFEAVRGLDDANNKLEKSIAAHLIVMGLQSDSPRSVELVNEISARLLLAVASIESLPQYRARPTEPAAS